MDISKSQLMQILCTELYKTQLKTILESNFDNNLQELKRFKTYLDAVVINIPTKVDKYKTSIVFQNENIKEIDFENYTIFVHCDKKEKAYLVLSIIEKIKN